MVWHLSNLWLSHPSTIALGQRFALVLGFAVALEAGGPAIAQSQNLTQAELYRIQNQVQLLPYQQSPRPAALADPLFPRDGVQTQRQSRAEVLFDEGSLARIGANSIFRFIPGLRNYQLPGGGLRAESVLQLEQGIALVMGPSGSTTNQVQTPDTTIEVAAANQPDGAAAPPINSAVVVVCSAQMGNTQVFNLTANPVTISNQAGTETITLQAGETSTVTNGTIGPVETFDLNLFYQTSGLSAGLGPTQADLLSQESAQVQAILEQIRTATVAAANTQARQLAGFCDQDLAAQQADNCITTPNDPQTTFEDERELITPPPAEPPPPSAPPGGSIDPLDGGGDPRDETVDVVPQ